IEVTIAMALLALAGLMAMEVFNMISKTSQRSIRANGHLEFHVSMVKILNQGVTGIKGFELDDNLFYSATASNKIARSSTAMDEKALLEYTGAERKVTSHRFRGRIDTDLIEYY